jgi:hypothetical protein
MTAMKAAPGAILEVIDPQGIVLQTRTGAVSLVRIPFEPLELGRDLDGQCCHEACNLPVARPGPYLRSGEPSCRTLAPRVPHARQRKELSFLSWSPFKNELVVDDGGKYLVQEKDRGDHRARVLQRCLLGTKSITP